MRERSQSRDIGSVNIGRPFMQDAHIGSWVREAQVPGAMLESVRELNHRFLDLVALGPSG